MKRRRRDDNNRGRAYFKSNNISKNHYNNNSNNNTNNKLLTNSSITTTNNNSNNKNSIIIDGTNDRYCNYRNLITPNFTNLATIYPDFALAFTNLKKRQRKTKEQQSQSSSSSTSRYCFSTNIDHSFNIALTRSILHQQFKLYMPFLPETNLVPPVPNRYHYVRWLKELICQISCRVDDYFEKEDISANKKEEDDVLYGFGERKDGGGSRGLNYRGLDLGVGASAIYPLLLSTRSFTSHDDCCCGINNSGINSSRSNNNVTNVASNITNNTNDNNDKWTFVGTDIDPESISCAKRNVNANDGLERKIQILLVKPSQTQQLESQREEEEHEMKKEQEPRGAVKDGTVYQLETKLTGSCDNDNVDGNDISCANIGENFESNEGNVGKQSSIDNIDNGNNRGNGGPIQRALEAYDNSNNNNKTNARFDFCMTNPPFYGSFNEANNPRFGDGRKRTEMTLSESTYPNNGEQGFVYDMIKDSLFYKNRITWYTSLLGRKCSLTKMEGILKDELGLWKGSMRRVETKQGGRGTNTEGDNGRGNNVNVRWCLAWSFRRVCIRSPEARIRTGLQNFEVEITDVTTTDEVLMTKSAAACKEVVRRIRAFCVYHSSMGSGVPLRCLKGIYNKKNEGDDNDDYKDNPCICLAVVRGNGVDNNDSHDDINQSIDHSSSGKTRNRPGNVSHDVPQHMLDKQSVVAMTLPTEGEFLIDFMVQPVVRHFSGDREDKDKKNDSVRSNFSNSSVDTTPVLLLSSQKQALSRVSISLSCFGHSAAGTSVVSRIQGIIQGEICRSNRRWRRLLTEK